MERRLYTARLARKLLLSDPQQCYHLEFTIEDLDDFPFESGQFVSMVAPDQKGKQQTRAYSIASAQRSNHFDLCVNRVQGGFFSNLLCDLEQGQTVKFHGPHGHFVLRSPLTQSIFIATGTGVAPMRSFVQRLFPESGEDRSEGRSIWLVYGTRHETELYYRSYFEKVAAERPNFHYLTTLSRADQTWTGSRGYVQDLVARIVEQNPCCAPQPEPPKEGATFGAYAYICGLNEMVAANRERLTSLGWHRKQVIFERYD